MVARIVPCLGDMRVQEISVRDVRRLLTKTALLAERTRYGLLTSFRQVMRMAVAEEIIVRDPSEGLQAHERPTQKVKRRGRRLYPPS